MSGRDGVFRIRSRYLFWSWGILLFFLIWATGFTLLSFSGRWYPDLDDLPFVYVITGLVYVMWSAYVYRLTMFIELFDDQFLVKKFGQKVRQYPYTSILTYNERYDSGRGNPFNELTVYLADNWFAIRSNEYKDYEYLKEQFTRYGQSVPSRTVFTRTERNRLRCMIVGMSLLLGVTIVFGFFLHNPANPNPARLISLTDTVEQVREDKVKGGLKGVTIRLRACPHFAFYVSRKNYDAPIANLQSAITSNRPISLLIRESEFRKKLRGTERLTVGDKYDNYQRIMVFGVTQGSSVRIQTPGPVYEPTHTNPLLRTFLLSMLLLLCWTGWVYVDRQPVLRGGPTGRN